MFTPQNSEDAGDLNRTETSLVGVATLRALGGVGPQLDSHVFGLMKAGNHRQSDPDRWLSSDEGMEWVLKTIDELCDVVREDSECHKAKL